MADSQLTVRTLGLAMVALVLACVHAARGDGRSTSVVSIGSGAKAGSAVPTRAGSQVPTRSVGVSGGVVSTIHGDPWVPPSDQRVSVSQGSQAARLAADRARRARANRSGSDLRDDSICVVRRVSVTQTQREWSEQARQIAAREPALASALQQPKPAAPLSRNAFSLGPAMLLGTP